MPRLPLLLLAPLLLATACTPVATTTRPATAPAPTTAPQQAETAPEAVEPPAPPRRPRTTADILGQPPEAVIELLGPASLDRAEGTARLLQFGGSPCILDVYFYTQADGAPAVATFTEARMIDGRDADASACIDRRIRDRENEAHEADTPVS